MVPFGVKAESFVAQLQPSYYPPALTGLRGSHPGSNTHAHAIAFNGKSDWGLTTNLKEEYDLVVVGGRISGLSAAYFYQQVHGRDKKVLILDNHDDFGGHAKRNEHTVGDDTRIIFGGSQTLQSPHAYSDTSKQLLEEIGVDLNRFNTAYDFDFFKRHNLGAVTYFNKKTFGEDKVVKHPYCDYPLFLEGLQTSDLSHEEAGLASLQWTPRSVPKPDRAIPSLLEGFSALRMRRRLSGNEASFDRVPAVGKLLGEPYWR